MSGGLRRVVCRPEQTLLTVKKSPQIILLPDMVPAGYHLNSQGKELVHQRCRKAEAIGGIFAVDYDHVRAVVLHQSVQSDKKSPASRLSYDIAKEQGNHGLLISHRLT